MTAPRAVCPECGSDVPEGRLSCPSCGALLAPVRGGAMSHSPAAASGVQQPAPPATSYEAEVTADGSSTSTPAPQQRAVAGPATPPPRSREPGPNEWYSTRGTSDADATRTGHPVAGRAAMLSDLPFDAPDTPPGWLAAVGSWLIAVAFPLPWVSSPFLGWLASWGFNPTVNVVPFALALAVAFATITPSRLSTRLRLGYLPAVAGLLALGMAWSWILLVPAAIGLIVLFVGAVVASAGGLWTLLGEDQRAGRL